MQNSKAHGHYTIECHQQVIVVRFYSYWNKLTSQNMCDEFLDVAKTIADQPWACLIDLSQWELGGPEVWEPILEVNHWCAKHNQQLEAVICTLSIQEYILSGLQQALPDTESQFFKAESSAKQWLADKGYSITF